MFKVITKDHTVSYKNSCTEIVLKLMQILVDGVPVLPKAEDFVHDTLIIKRLGLVAVQSSNAKQQSDLSYHRWWIFVYKISVGPSAITHSVVAPGNLGHRLI